MDDVSKASKSESRRIEDFKNTLDSIANNFCPCSCSFEAKAILRKWDREYKLDTEKDDKCGLISKGKTSRQRR